MRQLSFKNETNSKIIIVITMPRTYRNNKKNGSSNILKFMV